MSVSLFSSLTDFIETLIPKIFYYSVGVLGLFPVRGKHFWLIFGILVVNLGVKSASLKPRSSERNSSKDSPALHGMRFSYFEPINSA